MRDTGDANRLRPFLRSWWLTEAPRLSCVCAMCRSFASRGENGGELRSDLLLLLSVVFFGRSVCAWKWMFVMMSDRSLY